MLDLETGSTMRPPEIDLRGTAVVAALAWAFDLAVNGPRPGLSLTLLILAFAAGARLVSRPSTERDLFLLAAVVLGSFITLRADPALIAIDLLAAAVMLALAATAGGRSFFRSSVLTFAWRLIAGALSVLSLPRFVLVPAGRLIGRLAGRRATRILRAAVVVVPAVVVLTVLLASADRIFGDLVGRLLPSWNLPSIWDHAVLTSVGGFLAAWLVLAARRPAPVAPEPGATERTPLMRFAEWATLLASINLLFAVFVGVQFAFLFGGRARVEVTPGLTYAEYARSGFFQLIAVAILTGIVIVGTWDLGGRANARERNWFRWLVTMTIALTGIILASALSRLATYENEFGFTVNRLTAYVAMAYIAVALGIVAAAIWAGRREAVVPWLAIAAVVTLVAFNALAPDRFVAERNAERFRSTGKIDIVYMTAVLGDEAIPVAVDLLDELSPEDAATARALLCRLAVVLREPGDSFEYNAGRRAASDALSRAGIGPPGRSEECP